MAIVRCEQGHFYDNAKYTVCPVCSGEITPVYEQEEEKTISLEALQASEERMIHLTSEPMQSVRGTWDSGKTISLEQEEAELLVGWLVCTKGPMKGKDYRLYPGFNRIGRSLGSDICLQDPQVSYEYHCAVVYEGKKRCFYLVPGTGTLTYVNDELTEQAVEIQGETSIHLGGSVLELVIFCRGEHVWTNF